MQLSFCLFLNGGSAVVEVSHVLTLVVPVPVPNAKADHDGTHYAECDRKAQRVGAVEMRRRSTTGSSVVNGPWITAMWELHVFHVFRKLVRALEAVATSHFLYGVFGHSLVHETLALGRVFVPGTVWVLEPNALCARAHRPVTVVQWHRHKLVVRCHQKCDHAGSSHDLQVQDRILSRKDNDVLNDNG